MYISRKDGGGGGSEVALQRFQEAGEGKFVKILSDTPSSQIFKNVFGGWRKEIGLVKIVPMPFALVLESKRDLDTTLDISVKVY